MDSEQDRIVSLKIVVEKHDDGYVAYPLGLNGVVVGQGDSVEEALSAARSAAAAHIATFGAEALADTEVEDAVVCSETIRIACPDSPETLPRPA